MDHSVNRLHYDIEVMTRRLEVEKRRLNRLEKELATSQRMLRAKVTSTALMKRGHASARPSSREARARSAGTSHVAPAAAAIGGAEADDVSAADGDALVAAAVLSEGEASAGGGGSRVHVPIKVLMNRLDFHRKQLNAHKAEITDFRGQIDQMRRGRLACNDVFEKLRQEIACRASQLSDFVQETQAREALHDDVKHRLAVMKEQRESERGQFKGEVMRVRDQLKIHALEKKEVEVQLKNAKEVQKKRELIVPEEETSFSELHMMRRILKTAFLNCIQRRHIKQHQESIEVFMQAFANIKQSTGIEHIEEIVKIFVNLETRNYSYLTYVNHMNREIENLESRRRERRKLELEGQHQVDEHQRLRQAALLDVERGLQSTQALLAENRAAHNEYEELIENLLPLLKQMTERLEGQTVRIRGTGGVSSGEGGLRRRPEEMRRETVPQWLEWLEQALGKFRDLLPVAEQGCDADGPFPVTAVATVKQLLPKRLGGHVPPAPLVKVQELPCSMTLSSEEALQVKASKAQKADLIDEENEEEDFGDKPLPPTEIRSRAKQAAERRWKRTHRSGQNPSLGTSQAEGVAEATVGLQGTLTTYRGSVVAGPKISSLKSRDADAVAGGGSSHGGSNVVSPAHTDLGPSPKPKKTTWQEGVGDNDGTPAHESIHSSATGSAKSPVPRRSVSGQTQGQGQSGASGGAQEEVSDAELNMNFLMKYRMSKAELQAVADRMGIDLVRLCRLKYEFDQYDEDKCGYIDIRELRSLLQKLGQDPGEEEVEEAAGELDQNGSGEIEFFEFAEWYCATLVRS